jgi:hypothetical protein
VPGQIRKQEGRGRTGEARGSTLHTREGAGLHNKARGAGVMGKVQSAVVGEVVG